MNAGGEGKTVWDYLTLIATGWWVVVISSWGGLISYFHHMGKHGIPFNLLRLCIDVSTSAFVGVLTYLICNSAGLSDELTAAMVGVGGHMGTRALFILERRYEKLFGSVEEGTNGKD